MLAIILSEISWSCGVVVITSALHAEGPQFDPGRDQRFFVLKKFGFGPLKLSYESFVLFQLSVIRLRV